MFFCKLYWMMRKIIRTFIGILLCIFHIYIYVRFVIKLHAFMYKHAYNTILWEQKILYVCCIGNLARSWWLFSWVNSCFTNFVGQSAYISYSFIYDKASHFLVLVRLHFLKIDTCLQHLPVMHSQLLIYIEFCYR